MYARISKAVCQIMIRPERSRERQGDTEKTMNRDADLNPADRKITLANGDGGFFFLLSPGRTQESPGRGQQPP